MVLMAGVIFTEPEVSVDADADADAVAELRVVKLKWLSGTSPYLGDILHPPQIPDGDHDGWEYLH